MGNGDTSQIVLNNGKRFLFDFHHCSAGERESSPIIDLDTRLKKELKDAKRDYFDVVAFTHGDTDHIKGSTSFFELRHADKYQGEGRIKIKELWIPAAMILETASNDNQSAEFVIWRQEARHRLKQGEGIRVFSKPDALKSWLESEGLTVKNRQHLITDAGCLVPGFSLDTDDIEFFCHSPFIKHVDEGDDLRNEAALIFNVRFHYNAEYYNYLAIGDTKASVLSDIVEITEYHQNEDRLEWDILSIPHHCSYLALNEEAKGDRKTTPTEEVKRLLQRGTDGSYMICSSNPIEDTSAAYKATQPPHIQAKKCYDRYLEENGGAKLLVTMEEPNKEYPEPIELVIGDNGITMRQIIASASSGIVGQSAPRAGRHDR